MMARYQQILRTLRDAFPQPISDPKHDAYMVFTILRALDQVDRLKSDRPLLGDPVDLDWSAARASRLRIEGLSLEEVIPQLVARLEGMLNWGHPRCQVNVIPPPSVASIIGVLLPSMYNPNLVSEEYSRRVAEAEVRSVTMVADLVGYNPDQSMGLFTFGGTGSLLYGLKVGLEKAVPGCMISGLRQDVAVLASEESHYCVLNAAAWLGIGQAGVVRVPADADNAVRIEALEKAAREVIAAGRPIAAIVATMGTTDAFGIDDLQAIHDIRERMVEELSLPYRPHIHADGAIGWPWSVFNDYDFQRNDLGFRGRTLRALATADHRLRHLGLADTVGVDFHKTGFAPYNSSAVLFRDAADVGLIARDREVMPYLYETGAYHPGMFTLEASRGAAGAMAALANLLLFGKTGLRVLLGHIVEMAEVLREALEARSDCVVLNGYNVGPVTLFRIYPDDVDIFEVSRRELHDPAFHEQLLAYNDYNRRVFHCVYNEALSGRGVAISMTECYRHTEHGDPIVALKSFVLSPFSDAAEMLSIVEHVAAAKAIVDSQHPKESSAA